MQLSPIMHLLPSVASDLAICSLSGPPIHCVTFLLLVLPLPGCKEQSIPQGLAQVQRYKGAYHLEQVVWLRWRNDGQFRPQQPFSYTNPNNKGCGLARSSTFSAWVLP